MSSTDERHQGDLDQREDALRRAYAANHPDTKLAETGRAIGRALAAAVAQVEAARAETSRTVEAAAERAAQVLHEANDALYRLFDQAFNTAGHDEGRDRSVRDRDAVQAVLEWLAEWEPGRSEAEEAAGRVEELLAKELIDDLASDIYRARANVRCLDCNTRYEERQDYGCVEPGRGHNGFTDDMLADAVEEARAEFATTSSVRFDLVELTTALRGDR